MAVQQSPQLGYNHNIPHRGRLYHVQTEDSGIARAHIFTHVFFDGTIISTNKVDYRSKLETAENADATIISLMQESHKAMIRQLRSGAFDDKIVRYIGPHPDGSGKPEARPDEREVPLEVGGAHVQPRAQALEAGHLERLLAATQRRAVRPREVRREARQPAPVPGLHLPLQQAPA